MTDVIGYWRVIHRLTGKGYYVDGNGAIVDLRKLVVPMGSVAPVTVRPFRRGLMVVGPSRWQWFDPYAGRERAERLELDLQAAHRTS